VINRNIRGLVFGGEGGGSGGGGGGDEGSENFVYEGRLSNSFRPEGGRTCKGEYIPRGGGFPTLQHLGGEGRQQRVRRDVAGPKEGPIKKRGVLRKKRWPHISGSAVRFAT